MTSSTCSPDVLIRRLSHWKCPGGCGRTLDTVKSSLSDIPPLPIRGTGSSTFISTSWQHVCEEQLDRLKRVCTHWGGVTFSFTGCFCCEYKLLYLFCIQMGTLGCFSPVYRSKKCICSLCVVETCRMSEAGSLLIDFV